MGLLALAAPAAAVTQVNCSGLASAIGQAQDGDVLQLAPGVCDVNLTISNPHAFTLKGATNGTTTLEPVDPSVPIIAGPSSADVRFKLSGLTFTGAGGGAISLQGPGQAVSISGDTFTANSTPTGAGAAISIQTAHDATTTDTTVISDNFFEDNAARGGGAIAVLSSPLPLEIAGNTFVGNSSKLAGGAVELLNEQFAGTDAVRINGNSFGDGTVAGANTTQGQGGAVYVEERASQPLTMAGNTFRDNAVTGSSTAIRARQGGAVFLTRADRQDAYPVTQTANVFTGNRVDETQTHPTPRLPAGGGAEWLSGIAVASSYERFSDNRVAVNDGNAPLGGAVGLLTSLASPPAAAQPGGFFGTEDLFLDNSTAARGNGGAIDAGEPPKCPKTCAKSSVALNDSSVLGNTIDPGAAARGSAIAGSAPGHFTLQNSVVFGNAPQPELSGFGNAAPRITFTDACTESLGTRVPSNADNICADPRLDASGHETSTSPTLDLGSNALVPSGITADLAGNPRVISNRLGCSGPLPAIVDMGAFEYTGHSPPPPCPAQILLVNAAPAPWTVKRGHVKITLTCVSSNAFCAGTVSLVTVKPFRGAVRHGRKAKRRRLDLGNGRFLLVNGATETVAVKLRPGALRLLAGRRTVKIEVGLAARDASGAQTGAELTGKLKLGRRSAHRRHR